MPDPSQKPAQEPITPRRSIQNQSSRLDPEKYARLKAEAENPYRSLRQFVYLSCGASGLIGGFIFLMQLLAGREVGAALPNFAIQVGVVALMVWLYRLEQRSSRKSKS